MFPPNSRSVLRPCSGLVESRRFPETYSFRCGVDRYLLLSWDDGSLFADSRSIDMTCRLLSRVPSRYSRPSVAATVGLLPSLDGLLSVRLNKTGSLSPHRGDDSSVRPILVKVCSATPDSDSVEKGRDLRRRADSRLLSRTVGCYPRAPIDRGVRCLWEFRTSSWLVESRRFFEMYSFC